VFGHSGFLHQVQGIRPPGGVHLFQYAGRPGALARRPLVGRRRPHAGAVGRGYALENRLVVSRVFPQMFRDLHVQRLAAFFARCANRCCAGAQGRRSRRWSCC
jgi:uncharacterized circularly permuted ATP-grasp superfamily protein